MKRNKNKIWRGIKILLIIMITFISFVISLFIAFRFYVTSIKDDIIDLNLKSLKSGASSKVYALNKLGSFEEYKEISGNFNRIWVDFQKIPKHMKDVIIAMEDKRFYKHGGIDFIRTFGAASRALLGKKGYGGSTITQQLVKNLTNDSETTFQRKFREIGRAFRLEDRMSKDEILEMYLNIVNFGAGTSGVQAAANTYFDKNIENCSLAECASIAVITKNPSKYNPLTHPDENKTRREVALKEMLNQKKISQEEYDKSMKESNSLKFAKTQSKTSKNKKSVVRNWYVESLFTSLVNELSEKYKIKKEIAEEVVNSGGLKIYSCVDPDAQKIAEETINNSSIMPKDKELELSFMMIDYNGRILATLGSSKPKNANFIYNRAFSSKRQPGSVIKPISVYAPAIDSGLFSYSSKIKDEPLEIDFNGSGTVQKWPKNWYKDYKGSVTLQWAIEKSANAPVAQVLNSLGLNKSFNFLTKKLNFSSLDSNDAISYASLATGGTHVGVTIREIVNAYQIFGNGGKFFNPNFYFYVTDKDGNVILDHRNENCSQVISSESAYIMNRLLRQVICGAEGTGRAANINGYEIVGKTGTTNNDFDSWFVGLTSSCLSAIWTGYDQPKRIKETSAAIKIWKHIMSEYLKLIDSPREFKKPQEVKVMYYCTETGCLANENCPNKRIGYYCNALIPDYCVSHGGNKYIIRDNDVDNYDNNPNFNGYDYDLGDFYDSLFDDFFESQSDLLF